MQKQDELVQLVEALAAAEAQKLHYKGRAEHAEAQLHNTPIRPAHELHDTPSSHAHELDGFDSNLGDSFTAGESEQGQQRFYAEQMGAELTGCLILVQMLAAVCLPPTYLMLCPFCIEPLMQMIAAVCLQEVYGLNCLLLCACRRHMGGPRDSTDCRSRVVPCEGADQADGRGFTRISKGSATSAGSVPAAWGSV